MNAYLLPGLCGLLLGLTLHWTGFTRPAALRDTLALRRSYALRSGLYTLGFSMALTALLCWLAVIDVDTIDVLPLSAGALIGGTLFGVGAGLCGFLPLTAFGGIGGGPALEALCAAAGCLVMTWLLPALDAPLSALRTAAPYSDTTLFRVTLDEAWLLDGGFLGHGCAGLLLMAIAACIPSPKVAPVAEAPEPEVVPEEEVPPPEEAPEDAFVALLPGEEPMVVDTAAETAEDEAAEEPAQEEETAEEPAEDASEIEDE